MDMQRVRQVCFDEKKQAYNHRKDAMASSNTRRAGGGLDVSVREKSPNDASLNRLKDRSHSRNARLEEKLMATSGGQIQRQPSQQLKALGAYRQLRQSSNTGQTEARKYDLNVSQIPENINDSSVLQGSPGDKSYFKNMREKSEARSKSRSQTRGGLNLSSNNIAEQMQQIQKSASRSRSRTGASGGGRRGRSYKAQNQNQLKSLELDISNTITNKQSALQRNLQQMKERMHQRQKSRENCIAEQDNSFVNLGYGSESQIQSNIMSMADRTSSPFAQRKQEVRASNQNLKQSSFSPPSFRNRRTDPARQSFGMARDDQSFAESSIANDNTTQGQIGVARQSIESSISQLHQMMQIPMRQKTLDIGSKLKNAQNFINCILNMISDVQEQYVRESPVLPQPTISELRLKLTGAFERLEQISDEVSKTETLTGIFQNFFADISNKIQRNLAQREVGEHIIGQSGLMQSILLNLIDQITQYEFYDALPYIGRGMHDLRISLAVQKLQTLHAQKSNSSGYVFFNQLKRGQVVRKTMKCQLKKILKRYDIKSQTKTRQAAFNHWRLKIQKEYRDHLKHIASTLTVFGDRVISKAPTVNYRNCKGLPDFIEEAKQMLVEVLKTDSDMIVDIMFLNKSNTQAVTFEQVHNDEGELADFMQHTLDLVEHMSLLKGAIAEKFREGKKLEHSQFSNIVNLTNFSMNVDLPIMSPEEKQGFLDQTESAHQLIFPILSANLKQVKMVVRLTSTNKQSIMKRARVQFFKFTIEEVAPTIMKNLEKFKTLSKQFSQFHENLARRADTSLISDRTLEQLQILNQASLELACQNNVSQIFELITRTVGRLMLNPTYDKFNLLTYRNDSVFKVHDNSKTHDAYFNQVKQEGVLRVNQGAIERPVPEQIRYVEETNQAVKEKMREMGTLCAEGACPPWIQILLEQADPLAVSGKAIKDIVIIPIAQKNALSSVHSLSKLGESDTNDNQTSYAWESSEDKQQATNQVTDGASEQNEVYFLKLEKKLSSVNNQVAFDSQVNTQAVLSPIRSLIKIGLSKIKSIGQKLVVEKETVKHFDIEKSGSDNQDNFLKLTEQNHLLKSQLKVQKVVQKLFSGLNQDPLLSRQFGYLDTKLRNVIQDFIPNAKMTQLLLAKDDDGEALYTYGKLPVRQSCEDSSFDFASLIRAQHSQQANARDTLNLDEYVGEHRRGRNEETNQNTAVFKNQRKMSITDQEQNAQITTGGRQFLPSQIDDLSSIDGGAEFMNANNANRYKNQNRRIMQQQQLHTQRPGGDRHRDLDSNEQRAECNLDTQSGFQTNEEEQNNEFDQHQNLIHIDDNGNHYNAQGGHLATHARSPTAPHILSSAQQLIRSSSSNNVTSDRNEHQLMGANAYPMTFSNEQQENGEGFIQQMGNNTGPQKNLRKYYSAKGDLMEEPEEQMPAFAPRFDHLQNALMGTGAFKINMDQRLATQQVTGKLMGHRVEESSSPQEMIGLSSYAELLDEMVEDEFELTVDEAQNPAGLQKIMLRPFELSQKHGMHSLLCESIQICVERGPGEYNSNPVVRNNCSHHTGFNDKIDGLIQSGKQLNPHKRPLKVSNCIYAPIVVAKTEFFGVLQLANVNQAEGFTEQDVKIVKIICNHLAEYLKSLKTSFYNQLNVKRRFDATLLSTQIETSQANQILVYSNKLFQEQRNPLVALQRFVEQAERYLMQQFNCEGAQILLIDKENDQFLSFDPNHKCQLIQRGPTCEKSVSNHVLNNETMYSFPPIKMNSLNMSMLSRTNSICNQSLSHTYRTAGNGNGTQYYHLSFLFNQMIDAPPEFLMRMYAQNPERDVRPLTYMAQAFQGQDEHTYLGVVQLMQKADRQKFNEQDVVLLQSICDQLSQVFSQINDTNFLNSVSLNHFQGVYRLNEVLDKKYKAHLKQFFFELIAIKHGKKVVLKNKIIRKQLTHRMEMDKEFVRKLDRLAALGQKFTNRTKRATIARFNAKIKQLEVLRKENAEKCAAILNKTQKVLAIRMKDVMFQQWLQRLKNEKLLVQNHEVSQGQSLMNSQIVYSDMDLTESAPRRQRHAGHFSDDSSIISSQLTKAKKIYRLKKIFNKNCLKPAFDIFVLKLFQHYKRGYKILREGNQREQLRNLCLHRILVPRLRNWKRKYFEKMWKATYIKKQASHKLQRLIQKTVNSQQGQAFQSWRELTSMLIRLDANNQMQMLQDSKQQNIFDQLFTTIIQSTSRVFQDESGSGQALFRTVEECFSSQSFRQMMYEIFEYIVNTSNQYPFIQQDLVIEEIVFNFALPPGHNILMNAGGVQFAQFSFSKKPQRLTHQLSMQHCAQTTSQSPSSNSNGKDRTFGSIAALLNEQRKQNQEDTNRQSALRYQQILEGTQYQQTMEELYDLDFNIEEMNSDTLINAICSTEEAFSLKAIQYDQSLSASLQRRKISCEECLKDIIVVPIKDANAHTTGSIEIYIKGDEEQLDRGEELVNYQLILFEKYASLIGVGMKNFMVSMINNLSIQASMVQNELNFELSTFMPAQLTSLASGQEFGSSPIRFTKLVYEVDLMVKKAFRADLCRVIFLPYRDEYTGIFMEGPYNYREMFKIDLEDTLVAKILNNPGCAQLTMPSSLVCPSNYKPLGTPDSQLSVRSEQFQAIKYLTIQKSQTQIFAVIEIGWTSLQQAISIHENQLYLSKKEMKIVQIAKETISQTYIKLKLITNGIKQKHSFEILKQKLRGCFTKWKRTTFLQQFQNDHNEQENINFFNRTNKSNENINKSQIYTPILPIQHLSQDESNIFKKSYATAQNGAYSSLVSPLNANLAKYKSQKLEQQMASISMMQDQKQQVLENSSRLFSIMQKRQDTRAAKLLFFTQWKSFMQNARLAENAFEQIMQIHQKHSKQRYSTAVALLSKIDRKVSYRQTMEKIVMSAIQKMTYEKKQYERKIQKDQQEKEDQYIKQKVDRNAKTEKDFISEQDSYIRQKFTPGIPNRINQSYNF